jgi:hypothetical protein
MHEILAKHAYSKTPLTEQEYCEIRLLEWDEIRGFGFFICIRHAAWSEELRRTVWTSERIESVSSLEAAKELYETRRAEAVRAGYAYSDMKCDDHSEGQ